MKHLTLFICALAVVAVTTLSFLPVLKSGFVNLDDNVLVYDNAKIMSLSPVSVKEMFTSFHMSLYHPLVLISYAVEYHFFGADPAVYHATNLYLHLFNSLLVLWLVFLLTGQALPAFLVALLFGIHPMHVESVAWISERKDVLYAFFFLLSLALYVLYVRKDRKYFYFLSFASFALSLLSKPMAVTLPLVLVLFDFMLRLPRQQLSRRAMEKIPFFAVAGIFIWVTMQGQYANRHDTLLSSVALLKNTLVAAHDILFYLWKAVLPVKLAVLYPSLFPAGVWPSGFVLYGPAILLLLAALVIFSLRYTRTVLYGSLFFLITIMPVVNFVPVGLGIAADRYTYVPYIGLFFIFAAGIAWLAYRIPATARLHQGMFYTSLCILLVGLSVATWQRAGVWKNDFTLYTDVITHYKDVPIAYNNRGFAHMCKGDLAQAVSDCSEAVRLYPQYFDALNNLGNIYLVMHDFDRAESCFQKAKSAKPDKDTAYVSLGNLCKNKGDYDAAFEYYRKAIEVNTECDRAYYNIGSIYQFQGDDGRALTEYNTALKINPYNIMALTARGDLALRRNDLAGAINDYSRIIVAKPTAVAYGSRGLAYRRQCEYRKAIDDFSNAIALDKNCANAYCQRGDLLGLDGQYDEALADYNRALGVDAQLAQAYAGRSVVYYYKKQYERAVHDVRQARTLGYPINQGFLAALAQAAASDTAQ